MAALSTVMSSLRCSGGRGPKARPPASSFRTREGELLVGGEGEIDMPQWVNGLLEACLRGRSSALHEEKGRGEQERGPRFLGGGAADGLGDASSGTTERGEVQLCKQSWA